MESPERYTVYLWGGSQDGTTLQLSAPVGVHIYIPIPNTYKLTDNPMPPLRMGIRSEVYKHTYTAADGTLHYTYLETRKEKMFCGYCHGTHNDEVELMRCQVEKKEMDLEEAFWTPDTVVGYRGFTLLAKGVNEYALRGVKMEWKAADPGPAKCRPMHVYGTSHEGCPIVACMCGYYLLKDPDDVGAWEVNAKVEAWGDIVEHEKGYRVERIRILELSPGPRTPGYQYSLDRIKRVAEIYEVPYVERKE